MRYLLILFIQIISCHLISQNYVASFDSIQPEKNYENINVKKLSSDINATTFAIWVKKSVRLHKHVQHVENVYISEGYGEFQLGDSTYKVKSGDLIIIPKNTWHGVVVKSKEPMKVISIQSPEFTGNDRIFKDN
tara:strand:- start:43 stop:444 length:402 start_codon:yes stop_codon:yes gene_type:complete